MFDAHLTQDLYSAYIHKTLHEEDDEYISSPELKDATPEELLAEINKRLAERKTALIVVSDRNTEGYGADFYAASFNSLEEARKAEKEENNEYYANISFFDNGKFLYLGGYTE